MLMPHEKQIEVLESRARFNVIRAGRRSGKSTLEVEKMVYKAVNKSGRSIFYVAPTQKQARAIIWKLLKRRLGGIGELNESRLEVTVPAKGGISKISVFGFEARENFRGVPADHITFDEIDSCRDFFIGWTEIFRPTLLDTAGTADFIGTPKRESPNLRRLEKIAEKDADYKAFHFTSLDNPFLPREELKKAKEEMDADIYRQEILAEYLDNTGSLFRYDALEDLFTNTITKSPEKFHIVDIADDGSDKTVSSLWEGLELYQIDQYERLNTEGIISMIREKNAQHRVPYSQTAVDAIGVGAGVASSSLLDGIIGFKSSYRAMRIDQSIVQLPNVHYLTHAPLVTEYKNLRSQCIFTLAELVNNHKIACRISDVRIKERIIEELSLYQDAGVGDGKRMATQKEDIKALLGRSPDLSDTLIMRCYFQIRSKLVPARSEDMARVDDAVIRQLSMNENRMAQADTR